MIAEDRFLVITLRAPWYVFLLTYIFLKKRMQAETLIRYLMQR